MADFDTDSISFGLFAPPPFVPATVRPRLTLDAPHLTSTINYLQVGYYARYLAIQQPLGCGRGKLPESSLYPRHASSLLPPSIQPGHLQPCLVRCPGHALMPRIPRGYNMSKDDSRLPPWMLNHLTLVTSGLTQVRKARDPEGNHSFCDSEEGLPNSCRPRVGHPRALNPGRPASDRPVFCGWKLTASRRDSLSQMPFTMEGRQAPLPYYYNSPVALDQVPKGDLPCQLLQAPSSSVSHVRYVKGYRDRMSHRLPSHRGHPPMQQIVALNASYRTSSHEPCTFEPSSALLDRRMLTDDIIVISPPQSPSLRIHTTESYYGDPLVESSFCCSASSSSRPNPPQSIPLYTIPGPGLSCATLSCLLYSLLPLPVGPMSRSRALAPSRVLEARCLGQCIWLLSARCQPANITFITRPRQHSICKELDTCKDLPRTSIACKPAPAFAPPNKKTGRGDYPVNRCPSIDARQSPWDLLHRHLSDGPFVSIRKTAASHDYSVRSSTTTNNQYPYGWLIPPSRHCKQALRSSRLLSCPPSMTHARIHTRPASPFSASISYPILGLFFGESSMYAMLRQSHSQSLATQLAPSLTQKSSKYPWLLTSPRWYRYSTAGIPCLHHVASRRFVNRPPPSEVIIASRTGCFPRPYRRPGDPITIDFHFRKKRPDRQKGVTRHCVTPFLLSVPMMSRQNFIHRWTLRGITTLPLRRDPSVLCLKILSVFACPNADNLVFWPLCVLYPSEAQSTNAWTAYTEVGQSCQYLCYFRLFRACMFVRLGELSIPTFYFSCTVFAAWLLYPWDRIRSPVRIVVAADWSVAFGVCILSPRRARPRSTFQLTMKALVTSLSIENGPMLLVIDGILGSVFDFDSNRAEDKYTWIRLMIEVPKGRGDRCSCSFPTDEEHGLSLETSLRGDSRVDIVNTV
ncbi:uncharacterized protein CLUP02_05154 [Colletotrichum lupini]|uniref:Uncharacterized protein n=1 Tax=Colletotrichum lupini TaxID=145971 RepID=A0A9Q8WDT4_9PEZI|nr:uncharacterized protein CLUP02_05154 [Colletotrichum lupini]UQC79674.1 hypothetical protein CLUP02_05154 [Colletotrichum lupini]